MRIATFNLESLDLPPKAKVPIEVRAAVLRPQLERLEADILCLQEINGQHVQGVQERRLIALDRLLEGTRYAHYARAETHAPGGRGSAPVHNLVTLSRFAIVARRELLHELEPPISYVMRTDRPHTGAPAPLRFDRPVLLTEIELPGGRRLAVVNVHLRAPLAASVPGQKLEPFVWRSTAGWAEGYFLSALRRAHQALEVRVLVDELLDAEPDRLLAVAGDLNVEDHEVALRLLQAAEEDTGNPDLAARALVLLDRALPADRRWSVLHHGRPQMLDHILASRALHGRFRAIEVHNETLGDELVGYARGHKGSGSFHAPLVATFAD
ncbi:MAG: endonuclease/exonuclease/phosphatase family protein [Hyphomicrobiaceae bacterium]|nr:endonuclease/exonuclease/phosphatase family protein [Hyphomicrobiaceae bacterium]